VVHGDDPCIVDGKDVYESAVKMGTRCCCGWSLCFVCVDCAETLSFVFRAVL
jgi:hypothetical protein